MDKVLYCECGFEARTSHEVQLAAEIQRPALEAHCMSLSLDEALLLASRAELAQGGAPPTFSYDTTARAKRKEARS